MSQLAAALLVLAVLFLPSLSWGTNHSPADTHSPTRASATDGPGPALTGTRVTLVKDRVGGFFEPAPKPSRQVSWIRQGREEPLEAQQPLGPGDAIRSAAGVAVIELPGGTRIELGEQSQLRLARPLVHRLGTILYESSTPLALQVGGESLILEEGRVRVASDSQGKGRIEVLDGRVRSGSQQLVLAGNQAPLGPEGLEAEEPIEDSAAEAIALWRAERFLPLDGPPTERDRAHLRAEGGMSNLLTNNWGRGGIDVRVRVVDRLWLQVSAGILLRPGETDEGELLYWAVPLRVGARGIFPLRSAPLYFGAGADFQVAFFTGCLEEAPCTPVPLALPGARVSGIAGIFLDQHVALDIAVTGGFHDIASASGGSSAPQLVPQAGLSLGLVVRL
ncbi:MAG: hypothetical protein VX498_09735 [Myxococcota bacterium]|nr:hypothetical protein [Myxococcota bacterium]